MGAWDSGNFDNDTALDFVGNISDQVAEKMGPPDGIGDIDLTMAAVAIRKALVQHCHGFAPQRNEIESLRDAVLAVYDAEIDGLGPGPDFKISRRKSITDIFDQFLPLCRTH